MPAAIVVIISADAEWIPTKDVLRPSSVERTPYGEFFAQSIAGNQVVFIHGGWGKIAAAASAEYAIGRWQPEVLINLGTCGGIEGRVERGETLLVTRAIAYDIYEGIGDAVDAIRSYTTEIDLSWLDGDFPIAARRAPIVSGDRDLAPADVPDLIRRFDAVAADWESAAIAYVASRRRTRVLIIRTVSDLTNNERGEVIGALPRYQSEAAKIMRSLLVQCSELVPYVRRCC
jgi:adenosylhomocysteine nucleosidase